ncbi:MAG: DEAD/DEAH box helicase [Granulosicoccus sp.]
MTTRKSTKLTLHDKLSRLTFVQACKLLGPDGAGFISRGGRFDIDIDQQVTLTRQQFRLNLVGRKPSVVTIKLADTATRRLAWHCSTSNGACDEVGAALSLILEEKTALGLAAAPDSPLLRADLSELEINALEVTAREERAKKERMTLRSANPKTPWTDYQVTNKASGKTYRVALRGHHPGESYCSCPDYRKNTFGLCKHTIHVLNKVKRKFSAAQLRRPFKLKEIIVYLQYGKSVQLRAGVPDKIDRDAERLLKQYRKGSVKSIPALLRAVGKLENAGHTVTIYPDAEQYIQQRCWQARIEKHVAEIRKKPAKHPLRKTLLKAELLPYQLDGIAFAAGAGRAVLADDMGLGKTIQGIGVAALLKREANISRVLIVCPASLKSQWRAEIHKFSDLDCQLVVGSSDSRAAQYDNDCFFTVCNYEQVLRDILSIEQVRWDLIILDEGQRIKNWEAKTTRVIKSLKSPFALVLSGTPLENRIDELYSIVEFIDDRRLGPDFRFYQRHRVLDDNGRVIGFQHLKELRKNLKPVLLRRTRASVLDQLPPRTTDIVRIAPTEEQLELHGAHMRIVNSVIGKPFLSEMDLLRLQKALLMCRMSADSTFLCDKEAPGYSSKLEAIADLFDRIFSDPHHKVVLFSEWTTMLNLIEPLLKKRSIGFVRLDGSVPQKKRPALVSQFEEDKQCRLFMATNAGSTGLNLQIADTVINVDLPWTPALLEQRIGRVHRMGQKRPVHAFVLVTEDTLEESLLATLSAKHELALAVLDPDSDVDSVDLTTGIEALKQRLEVLLGAQPEAERDESQRRDVDTQTRALADRQRVSEAGGQLLSAAFNFLSEVIPAQPDTPASQALATDLKQRFSDCVEQGEDGKPQLTISLPDNAALDTLAESLAQLLAARQ